MWAVDAAGVLIADVEVLEQLVKGGLHMVVRGHVVDLHEREVRVADDKRRQGKASVRHGWGYVKILFNSN